jgi:acetyl-CoA carboxylase carboxyltransferase component
MGLTALHAPLQSQIVQWLAGPGDLVRKGDLLVILEAMKMEHELRAPCDGRLAQRFFEPRELVQQGDLLARFEIDPLTQACAVPGPAGRAPDSPLPPLVDGRDGGGAAGATSAPASRPDLPRPDLQRAIERHGATLDAARPEAMAKRHALGLRSARENIADLCDPGSFAEYGALAVAAQRSRRSAEDLIANTPADGMVTGIGCVNGALFAPAPDVAEAGRCVVLAYDATVLAGTQGLRNHQKTDRLLQIALRHRLPVVLFAEGGGGRPGDTDSIQVASLHIPTFASFARLSGQVPVMGVVAGRCFAGNAALLGCCDVIIATRDSNIGMGGPAMVEGGGLGAYRPEDIGPSAVQQGNGVIDVLVEDEAQAVAAARHYLSFFQGRVRDWQAPGSHAAQALRDLVPQNRLRVYDTAQAFASLADVGSLLLLREGFGKGIHTALARIEGRPLGLLANNPLHLGGAIDADAADKATRFMQLCNAHGLPLLALVDTPGFMVGPEIETRAQVRHVSRMFLAAAHLRVPCFSVVLRKGYGLGAMAMTAGGFHEPMFNVAWPTGEFGGMGLEGAVRLGYRKELEAAPQGAERDALFEQLVRQQYAKGEALNMAAALEIDAVIDPAETRQWLAQGLGRARTLALDETSVYVDAW